MAFQDILLFDDPLLGFRTFPDWQTQVFITGGGQRTTNQPWEDPLREFTLRYIRSQAALDNFYDGLHSLAGSRDSFRFIDYTDFKVLRQQIATGTGSSDQYQITKTYTRGVLSYTRDIKLIAAGTLSVWIDNVLGTEGVDYTVDYVTGLITATVATGLPIEAACEYHIKGYVEPGKFTIQGLSAGLTDSNDDLDDIWEVNGFKIVEERN